MDFTLDTEDMSRRSRLDARFNLLGGCFFGGYK